MIKKHTKSTLVNLAHQSMVVHLAFISVGKPLCYISSISIQLCFQSLINWEQDQGTLSLLVIWLGHKTRTLSSTKKYVENNGS